MQRLDDSGLHLVNKTDYTTRQGEGDERRKRAERAERAAPGVLTAGGRLAGEHSLSRLAVSDMSFSVSGSLPSRPPAARADPLPPPPSTAFLRMDLLRRWGSGVGQPLPPPPAAPRSSESVDSDDLLPPFLPASTSHPNPNQCSARVGGAAGAAWRGAVSP